jgi:hypothetical protein
MAPLDEQTALQPSTPTGTPAAKSSSLLVERRVDPYGALRLSVRCQVDSDTAPELERALHESITGEPIRVLIIDLAGVTFLDSTGIRVLIQ